MQLAWTEGDIRAHYRANRNLTILAELNDCDTKTIRDIVSDLIVKVEPKGRKYLHTREENQERLRIERNKWLDLYNEGKSDAEISEITGVNRGRVTVWRNSLKLPLNKPYGYVNKGIRKKSEKTLEREARQMVLYKKGLSDAAIGSALDCSSGAVYAWRKALGLPGNHKNIEQKRQASI